jgi:cytochrome c peroxidase
LLLAAALIASGGAAASDPGADPWLRPSSAPAPPRNAGNAAREALGLTLFFDPRLSQSKLTSCATCHNPALGWSDALPTAIGDQFAHSRRNTPTILNAAFNPLQMWDGSKRDLEDQVFGPITSPLKMNLPADQLVHRLRAIAGYAPLFERAYPGEGIGVDSIAKAVASYERTILSTDSPFDRWRRGDPQALGAAARRGFALFTGKARCALCHQGFNFTDNGYHNIGLLDRRQPPDEGRYAVVRINVLKGAFKTPTLRDVALTAPYMHDGRYATLEQVIDHYNRGGDPVDHLSPNIVPLGLDPRERRDLVEFLEALTGTARMVALPSLPR